MHITNTYSNAAAITPSGSFQPYMPADIRPHPIPTEFQKFEPGTSLVMTSVSSE